MQTPFRNEQTGRFDANVLKKFLTDYEGMKTKKRTDAGRIHGLL